MSRHSGLLLILQHRDTNRVSGSPRVNRGGIQITGTHIDNGEDIEVTSKQRETEGTTESAQERERER